MSDSKRDSVPEIKKGFTVNASPLNPVKLELGAIVLIGLFLLIINEFLTKSILMQVLVLGAYGLIAMLWLIIRTRRIVRKSQEVGHG